jgi:hypothetical protein
VLDVAGGWHEVIVAISGGAGAGSNDGGVTMKDVHDNIEKMFAGVSLLRRRLSVDGRLEVAHSGRLWTAAFEWFSPTSTEIILETQGQLGKTLPKDYASFLSSISNGAVMFFDLQYGQWGFKIYSTSELLERQRFWQHSLEGKWKPQFIAFAKNFGDEYVMVFDLERPTSEGMSCAVVQGSPYDAVEYWLLRQGRFMSGWIILWLRRELSIGNGDEFSLSIFGMVS